MGDPKNQLLLSLALFIAALSLFIPPSLSSTSPDDIAVLKKLATSLSPTPSGWSGADPCAPKWPGVNCLADRVVSINLASKSLKGTLPSDLNKLSSLQTLSLQNNQISGPLPSLANLSSLQEIYLGSNSFTSLPPTFFQGLTSLQTVTLSQNPFEPWSIPFDLSQSTSLTTFYASNANVMGSIPDFFGRLPSFQSLRLSYNNLTGILPASFASSAIQNLWLNNQGSASMLFGPITVLGSMAQISQVWLHSNAFTGPIPDLSNCTSLFDLQLRDNMLTGMLHASITSLPKLVNVSLDNNKFQGPYPNFPKGVEAEIGTSNSFCNAAPGPCDDRVIKLLLVMEGFGYPFNFASLWTGNDPCAFLYITCDRDKKGITVISLNAQHLVGTISPVIGNITTLQTLIFSNNNITGSIPESLTRLSQLQTIDVSNNNLTGKIPVFGGTVTLKASGNPFLGADLASGGDGSPGSDGSSASSTVGSNNSSSVPVGVIVGTVIAVVVSVGLIGAIIQYRIRSKRYHQKLNQLDSPPNGSELKMGISGLNGNRFATSDLHSQSSGEKSSDMQMAEAGSMVIPIQVLQQVTNNFSEDNELGRGGFGVVYKGELHDGTQIAVKRMESSVIGNKGRDEFQAEIAVLTKVRHRHLVALLGYCVDGNERLLVYECMPQGTLGQHLFDRDENGYAVLSWKQRLTIALDVARGIEYLHNLAQKSFIHRDLKPSNILLGDDMRAKVSDFGLVKLAPDGKYSVETRLAGTFGYLAPEYATTGRVTTKVDVYAYGVVLMELITGRKALDDSLPDEHSHLVSYFRRLLVNKDNIRKAVDPSLDPNDEDNYNSICTVAELSGHCTAREPYQRPDMGHVVNVLSPLVEQWKPATRDEEEDTIGIDLHMSLPQALERWQSNEGSSAMGEDLYGQSRTFRNSQSSLASKPSGIRDSFGSMDCR